MKDFEELRKLCCTDNPDGIKMTAASNGIEKDIKKGGNLILQTGKGILKLKKKKEEIPTLSDSQYEKLFQSVIDKTLEECIDNYVAWVQCSRKVCGKWRRLKDNVDPATLPQDWICSQNPDPLYNICDLPEEAWEGRENDVIYAELVPGSIVWAKQFGYPWWPAMVEHDPQTGKYFMFTSDSDQFPSKYHVTFFDDTVSHAWIAASHIKNFQELPQEKNTSKQDFKKRINAGKKMAEEAQRVKIQERFSLFGFAVRYKRNGGAELSDHNSSQGSLEAPCNIKKTKRSKSKNVEDDWNEDSADRMPIAAGSHQQKARKEKDMDLIQGELKRQRKQESPVQLVKKDHLTRPKQFRDPTLKRNNTRKEFEEAADSTGVKEPERGLLKAKPKVNKASNHDHSKNTSCLNKDLYNMEHSAASDLNAGEHSIGHKDTLRDSFMTLGKGKGRKNNDFTAMFLEATEKKQEIKLFSDDDMEILTAKKSEEEEEFAEFMFEE
ncbi:MORC family CW-type zinc finger protein 4-like isoform X9 [Hypanus sabinus]|uniref:MORC family CW-type zinc finger protein 4-like isoform X9 n=1 Tax=Hypanus sabinus TaxID=79690 RepID=UPI0028C4AEA7|nr:MORC family CW-type zinc finger protein 4-like isoform X9 [Hypanus sabinus]